MDTDYSLLLFIKPLLFCSNSRGGLNFPLIFSLNCRSDCKLLLGGKVEFVLVNDKEPCEGLFNRGTLLN